MVRTPCANGRRCQFIEVHPFRPAMGRASRAIRREREVWEGDRDSPASFHRPGPASGRRTLPVREEAGPAWRPVSPVLRGRTCRNSRCANGRGCRFRPCGPRGRGQDGPGQCLFRQHPAHGPRACGMHGAPRHCGHAQRRGRKPRSRKPEQAQASPRSRPTAPATTCMRCAYATSSDTAVVSRQSGNIKAANRRGLNGCARPLA
jgi:hypothetical protein